MSYINTFGDYRHLSWMKHPNLKEMRNSLLWCFDTMVLRMVIDLIYLGEYGAAIQDHKMQYLVYIYHRPHTSITVALYNIGTVSARWLKNKCLCHIARGIVSELMWCRYITIYPCFDIDLITTNDYQTLAICHHCGGHSPKFAKDKISIWANGINWNEAYDIVGIHMNASHGNVTEAIMNCGGNVLRGQVWFLKMWFLCVSHNWKSHESNND